MLEVRNATVRFGETTALDSLDLTVNDGATMAVLGPSGSGKTTLLRAIAGLQRLDAGEIRWDGSDLSSVPAHRRGFGMVFQDYALFPHLDVMANVAFGLKMRGDTPADRHRRAMEVLERVDLAELQHRQVATLSGGQQQRVALARALAPAPHLLLFDEPLGSLDRALRGRLAGELRDLLTEFSVTAIYVTHDHDEAFTVGDRVAILREGTVARRGTPDEVWRSPGTAWVADFLGMANVLNGVVSDGRLSHPFGSVPAPDLPSGAVRVVVRPEAISLGVTPGVEVDVISSHFDRGRFDVVVSRGQHTLEAVADRPLGDRTTVAIDPDGIVPISPE